MSAICILSGSATAKLALAAFTLAWTHSVEKVRWEEDVQVQGDQLVITEARIQGSGAGMEVPDGAVLEGGFWHYRPPLPPLPEIELANSGLVKDWEICTAGGCRSLGSYLPGTDSYVIRVCAD